MWLTEARSGREYGRTRLGSEQTREACNRNSVPVPQNKWHVRLLLAWRCLGCSSCLLLEHTTETRHYPKFPSHEITNNLFSREAEDWGRMYSCLFHAIVDGLTVALSIQPTTVSILACSSVCKFALVLGRITLSSRNSRFVDPCAFSLRSPLCLPAPKP